MLKVADLWAMQGIAAPADLSKQERQMAQRLAPEQQKGFKSLRSVVVSGMRPEVKGALLHEYIQRVFTKLGGIIERSGNPVSIS